MLRCDKCTDWIRNHPAGVPGFAMNEHPVKRPWEQPAMDVWVNLLDLTPEGRGTDWYPQLSYPATA